MRRSFAVVVGALVLGVSACAGGDGGPATDASVPSDSGIPPVPTLYDPCIPWPIDPPPGSPVRDVQQGSVPYGTGPAVGLPYRNLAQWGFRDNSSVRWLPCAPEIGGPECAKLDVAVPGQEGAPSPPLTDLFAMNTEWGPRLFGTRMYESRGAVCAARYIIEARWQPGEGPLWTSADVHRLFGRVYDHYLGARAPTQAYVAFAWDAREGIRLNDQAPSRVSFFGIKGGGWRTVAGDDAPIIRDGDVWQLVTGDGTIEQIAPVALPNVITLNGVARPTRMGDNIVITTGTRTAEVTTPFEIVAALDDHRVITANAPSQPGVPRDFTIFDASLRAPTYSVRSALPYVRSIYDETSVSRFDALVFSDGEKTDVFMTRKESSGVTSRLFSFPKGVEPLLAIYDYLLVRRPEGVFRYAAR